MPDIDFQSFTGALESHPYIFLFAGMLLAGESILLPAIYFTFTGKLSLPYVISVSILATVLSDIFWYFVGLHAKERFFERMIEGRVKSAVSKLSGAFARRGALLLFLSKFVYGIRVAAQVLAGAEKMPFQKYILVNICGVSTLIGAIALVAYSVRGSLGALGDIVHKAEVAFLAFFVLVVLIHVAVGAYLKKKWFQR